MSDTPDDDRIRLDRQDLTLDTEGMLDLPEELEKAEQADVERTERRNEAERDAPMRQPCP